jgi:hypothetical protein
LRELVAAIVVLPTPPGAPIEVEVRGRLAALIGHEVFPAARMWGGKVVAEARYSYSPPPEIAEFPLRLQSACASHFVT